MGKLAHDPRYTGKLRGSYPRFLVNGEVFEVRYFTQEPGGEVRAVMNTEPKIRDDGEVDWGPFGGKYGDEIVVPATLKIEDDGMVHIPG